MPKIIKSIGEAVPKTRNTIFYNGNFAQESIRNFGAIERRYHHYVTFHEKKRLNIIRKNRKQKRNNS